MAITWNRSTDERLATLQQWVAWMRDNAGDGGLTARVALRESADEAMGALDLPMLHEVALGLGIERPDNTRREVLDQIVGQYLTHQPRYIAVVTDSQGYDWVGTVDQALWDTLVDNYEARDSGCPVGRKLRLRKDGSWAEDGGWDIRPRTIYGDLIEG